MTPINSIEIPERFVELAGDWYNGSGCMLYAVSSTGGLTTGKVCPINTDDYTDRNDRDRKWYLHIWFELSGAVGSALQVACDDGDGCSDDAELLDEFDHWVHTICIRLANEYGLNDWELSND